MWVSQAMLYSSSLPAKAGIQEMGMSGYVKNSRMQY